MILVVGDLWRWERDGRQLPSMEGFRFVSFRQLSWADLQNPPPDLVVSALIGDGFDAVEVAARLSDLGYAGRYRAVVSSAVPLPEMIHEEVRDMAPGLDFALLLLNEGE